MHVHMKAGRGGEWRGVEGRGVEGRGGEVSCFSPGLAF